MYSFKEAITWFFIFLAAGFIVPLLFYPPSTWMLYLTSDSPLRIIEMNGLWFIAVEVWGFVALTIIRVFFID